MTGLHLLPGSGITLTSLSFLLLCYLHILHIRMSSYTDFSCNFRRLVLGDSSTRSPEKFARLGVIYLDTPAVPVSVYQNAVIGWISVACLSEPSSVIQDSKPYSRTKLRGGHAIQK